MDDVYKGIEKAVVSRNTDCGFVFENENDLPLLQATATKSLSFIDPNDLIGGVISGKILNAIDSNESINKSLDDHAKKEIQRGIKKRDTERKTTEALVKDKLEEATYERNKQACKLFGISDKSPPWQQFLMRMWYDILFIIWYIICLATLAPIMFVSLRIKAVIKHTWVTILLAIIVYALIVFTTMLITKFTI